MPRRIKRPVLKKSTLIITPKRELKKFSPPKTRTSIFGGLLKGLPNRRSRKARK